MDLVRRARGIVWERLSRRIKARNQSGCCQKTTFGGWFDGSVLSWVVTGCACGWCSQLSRCGHRGYTSHNLTDQRALCSWQLVLLTESRKTCLSSGLPHWTVSRRRPFKKTLASRSREASRAEHPSLKITKKKHVIPSTLGVDGSMRKLFFFEL